MDSILVISFFSSHGGSGALAAVQKLKLTDVDISMGCLITNNRSCEARSWAHEEGLPSYHISSTVLSPDAIPERIEEVLAKYETDIILLSGYMKLLPKRILRNYPNIFNIHPSLLPKYGGQGMYGDNVHRKVLSDGASVTGASLHRVNEIYDGGEVLIQRKINVEAGETVDSLRQKAKLLEARIICQFILNLEEFLI